MRRKSNNVPTEKNPNRFLNHYNATGNYLPGNRLGSEPNAMQASSNNQTAVPVQNPNSTQRDDSNAIASEANGASQSSDSVSESTQLKK